MSRNKDFQPASGCTDKLGCPIFGLCQEAQWIRQEASYERQQLGSSALASQISGSSCNHPDAVSTREEGNKLLR